MNTEILKKEEPVVSEKSKGQLFKEQYGYSKTLKRNMKKHKVSSPADYKAIRKARKKKERKVQSEKLYKNKVYRIANPRKKKVKGGKSKGIKPAAVPKV